MIQHKSLPGDPSQQVIMLDSAGSFFHMLMEPTTDGHDFTFSTNNPITPKEGVAHNLVIAAADVLTELGYPGALNEALDFTRNLAIDAFQEINKAASAALDDDLPF